MALNPEVTGMSLLKSGIPFNLPFEKVEHSSPKVSKEPR